MRQHIVCTIKPEAYAIGVNDVAIESTIFDTLRNHGIIVRQMIEFPNPLFNGLDIARVLYPRLALIGAFGSRMLNAAERNRLSAFAGTQALLLPHEALRRFNISADILTHAGDASEAIKLGPGAYASRIYSLQSVVINHFFPEVEVKFRVGANRFKILLCDAADIMDVISRRAEIIGDVDPAIAQKGSIRNILFENKERFGIDRICVANNFCHLPANLLEARLQVAGFFGPRLPEEALNVSDYVWQSAIKLSRLIAISEMRPMLYLKMIDTKLLRQA